MHEAGVEPRRDETSPGVDDDALIEACLAGDEVAWSRLVERYERLVYSVPRRHGLDGSAADEVFQEVWMALARQLPRLRRRRGLPKWLMTTAYRASCQWLRRNRSASPLEDGQAAVDAPSADNVEQWERHTVVNTALEALGPKCRELLVALYGGIDRPNYDDVARRVGMPRGSIGPTRARCLEQLTQILGRSSVFEGDAE